MPTRAAQDQRPRCRDRADPPAILRHAEPTPSWRGSIRFDAIGVDDDVEGGASNADQDGGNAV